MSTGASCIGGLCASGATAAARVLLNDGFKIRVAGWEGWVTLAVLVIGLALMFCDVLKTEFVMVAMLLALVWCRVLTPKESVEGFASSGVLVILALLGVTEGLAQTRALDAFFKRVLGRPSSVPAAHIRMALPLAFWSAFLNNTPVVALMIPILVTWSRATKLPVSKFMMPLSYVAQLGGMLTLIGSSTNLVIKEKYDQARSLDSTLPDLTIFRQTPYALPIALMGILYINIFGRWLLAGPNSAEPTDKSKDTIEEEEPIQVGMVVTSTSPAIGKTVAQINLAALDLRVNRINRDGVPLPVHKLQHRTINMYDELYISGDMKQVDALAAQLDLVIVTDEYDEDGFGSFQSQPSTSNPLLSDRLPDCGLERESATFETQQQPTIKAEVQEDTQSVHGSEQDDHGLIRLVHATVRDGAPIVGLSIREAKFRDSFGAAVVDIRAEFRRVPGPLSSVVLAPGHELLLDAGTAFDSASADMLENFENIHFAKAPVKQFLTAIEVPQGSEYAGKTLAAADLQALGHVYVTMIQRGEERIHAVDPKVVLEGGDVLWISGTNDAIHEIRNRKGLRSYGPQTTTVPPVHRQLIQAALSSESPLLGQPALEANFEQYDVALIAVHRSGKRLTSLADVRLRIGDCLLLEGSADFVKRHESDAGFVLLSPMDDSAPVRWNRSYLALLLLVALVAAQIGQGVLLEKPWIDFLPLCVTVVAIMLLTRCLSPAQLQKALKWDLYMTIAAAIGLSNALDKSGAAAMIADSLVFVGRKAGGNLFIVAAVYITTVMLSNVIANNAVGALLFPIVQGISGVQGIKLEYLAYILIFGTSSTFSTPFSYQCNILVQDVGGYSSKDYARFGVPCQVWQTAVTVLVMASPKHYYISLIVAAIICAAVFVPILARDTRQHRQPIQHAYGASGFGASGFGASGFGAPRSNGPSGFGPPRSNGPSGFGHPNSNGGSRFEHPRSNGPSGFSHPNNDVELGEVFGGKQEQLPV